MVNSVTVNFLWMASNKVNQCTPTMVKSPTNVTSVSVSLLLLDQLEDAYEIIYIIPDASVAVRGGQFCHG